MTLLLTGPYGHGDGYSISLVAEQPIADEAELLRILNHFSCHPPALPKIVASLRYSNRYDCVVQRIWFKRQYLEVKRDFAMIGISVTVTSHPKYK